MTLRWRSVIAVVVLLSFLPFAQGCGTAAALIGVAMTVKKLIATWQLIRILTGHDDRLQLGEIKIDLMSASKYELRQETDGGEEVVESGTWTVNENNELVMNVEGSAINPDDVGKTFVSAGRLEGTSTEELNTLVLGETGEGAAVPGPDAYVFEKEPGTEG